MVLEKVYVRWNPFPEESSCGPAWRVYPSPKSAPVIRFNKDPEGCFYKPAAALASTWRALTHVTARLPRIDTGWHINARFFTVSGESKPLMHMLVNDTLRVFKLCKIIRKHVDPVTVSGSLVIVTVFS